MLEATTVTVDDFTDVATPTVVGTADPTVDTTEDPGATEPTVDITEDPGATDPTVDTIELPGATGPTVEDFTVEMGAIEPVADDVVFGCANSVSRSIAHSTVPPKWSPR